MIQWFYFFSSGEPPLSYRVEKRRDPKKSRNFFGPASSQHYNSGGGGGGGGSPEKKPKKPAVSQLRPLATLVPSLGRLGQGAWELGLPQIRKCHFLSDPCVVGYIF